jgi:peptidoglycan hydrolase-like protein with peptidoglycan-binding domain
MSKDNINKEISQSERKKYLRTMMADLGVTSLSDLPSDEARKSLLKATEPRDYVKKRLKDMGYDFSGDNNKRSLGTCLKISEASAPTLDMSIDNAIALRRLIGTADYRKVLSDIYPRKWPRDTTLQTYKQIIIQKIGQESYSNNQTAIDEALKNIFDYLVDYNKKNASPSELQAYLSVGSNVVSSGHEYPGDVEVIQSKLEAKGFLSTGYSRGVYDEKTEAAVRAFQATAGLPTTGSVNYATFITFGRSDVKPGGKPKQEAVELESQRSFGEDLSFLDFKNPGGLTGIKEDTIKFLYILNDLAKESDKRITITSMYRSPSDQARVMLNNYNSRGPGSARAGKYLKRLYSRYPNVDQIVDIFAGAEGAGDKKQRAAQVIKKTWPKIGHLSGESIDLAPRDDQVKEILQKAQSYAEVNILDEGNHFHTSIKSLNPGGSTGSFNA